MKYIVMTMSNKSDKGYLLRYIHINKTPKIPENISKNQTSKSYGFNNDKRVAIEQIRSAFDEVDI